jgi:hypothetical protein
MQPSPPYVRKKEIPIILISHYHSSQNPESPTQLSETREILSPGTGPAFTRENLLAVPSSQSVTDSFWTSLEFLLGTLTQISLHTFRRGLHCSEKLKV